MFGHRKTLPKKLTKSAKGCFTERQKLFLLNFARHNYELAFESVGTDEVFRWFMSNRHSLDELGVTERLAVNYMKMWNSWVDRAKRLGWSKTLGDHHDITLYMIYTRTEAGYNASHHVNARALTSQKRSSSPVPATTTYKKTDVTPRRSLSREPSMPYSMEPSMPYSMEQSMPYSMEQSINTRYDDDYNASHVNAGALTSKKRSSSPVPATTTYRKTDVTPRRSLSRELSMPYSMEPSMSYSMEQSINTRYDDDYNASYVNAGALTSKKRSSSPVPATTTYKKTDVTPRRSLSREPSLPSLMEPSTDKATQYGKKLAKAFFSGFVEEYRSCEKAQETTEETVLVPDSDEERALMDYPDICEELNIKQKQKPLATIDVNTYEEDEYVKEYLLKQKSLYEDDEFYCLVANIENVEKKA